MGAEQQQLIYNSQIFVSLKVHVRAANETFHQEMSEQRMGLWQQSTRRSGEETCHLRQTDLLGF